MIQVQRKILERKRFSVGLKNFTNTKHMHNKYKRARAKSMDD